MRILLCGVVCSLALWGCESDVDLCGGGSVCGIDGNPYGSYCEAGEAGIDVAYAGACNDMCSDIMCRLDCQYGFLVEDACPVCTCAPPPTCSDDSPCTRGDVCRDDRCMPPLPTDDGGTDATIDSGPPCADGQTRCAGECVDLGTLENCTACGDSCDPASGPNALAVCHRSAGCDTECLPGFGDCLGDGVCTLLDTDKHCGACGNSCAAFGSCDLDGVTDTYECSCPAGRVDCDGTCVNTDIDGQYCGGCAGPACAAGTRCRGGSCTDEGGDACTNPANWDCSEGASNCDVRCGDIFFYGNPADGSFACESGGGGLSCFVPVGATCETCIDIAARCCFGG